jgi:hypothetical protein
LTDSEVSFARPASKIVLAIANLKM